MIGRIQEVLSRLVAVFRRRALDREFDEEFAVHIDLLTERNERRGLNREEARRQAILQMGGLNATKDLHSEARGLRPVQRFLDALHGVWRDLVYAARSLAKARASTAPDAATCPSVSLTGSARLMTRSPHNSGNGVVP